MKRKRGRPRSKSSAEEKAGGQVPSGARALVRGLDLLEQVSRSPATLSEIARSCELHPSTASRMLETMRVKGYLSRDEATGLYSIGSKVYTIGLNYDFHNSFRSISATHMERLRDKLNENVNLCVLEDREVVYIAQAESTRALRMFTQTGARAPLYCTGVGKALLFGKNADDVRLLLGPGPYPGLTKNTHTTLESFLKDLNICKERGYARDDEEREEGVRCIAVPIRGSSRSIIAAISISAPATRLPEDKVEYYALDLMNTAKTIASLYAPE